MVNAGGQQAARRARVQPPEATEVLAVSTSAVSSLLSARQNVRASSGTPVPDSTDPRLRRRPQRFFRAWELADIDSFVEPVAGMGSRCRAVSGPPKPP
jgi:hypothetical protein